MQVTELGDAKMRLEIVDRRLETLQRSHEERIGQLQSKLDITTSEAQKKHKCVALL